MTRPHNQTPHSPTFRPASVMTGSEAMAAIERLKAINAGQRRSRQIMLAHHEARNVRICKAYDEGHDVAWISREEDVSTGHVRNILLLNGRGVSKPVQPAAAALPAIGGRPASDPAERTIKWQTHDFAKALLAYHIRHQQVPATLGLNGLISQCRTYGVVVPQSYIDAAAATGGDTGHQEAVASA